MFITVFIFKFFTNILFIFQNYNIYNKINVMAKQQSKPKSTNVSVRIEKPKKKRPGMHSKCKSSKLKKSKNYTKKYRGQGK